MFLLSRNSGYPGTPNLQNFIGERPDARAPMFRLNRSATQRPRDVRFKAHKVATILGSFPVVFVPKKGKIAYSLKLVDEAFDPKERVPNSMRILLILIGISPPKKLGDIGIIYSSDMF